MNLRYVLCCWTLAWTATTSAQPIDGYVSFSSVANARHSADFLYGERHVVLYRQGHIAERVVLYTCRDGSPFAHKLVSYPDRLVPDFMFENASDGMREGIREKSADAQRSDQRTVYYRERTGAPEKSGPVPVVPGLVADAGFDEFVQMHWDQLVSGKALEMRFLIPGRLSDYGFQVQRLRRDIVAGVATEVFRLRLAGIWGWFLPGIDVYYGATDHLLMRYDGLSDLHDPSGNNYKTTIDFPVEVRKATTMQAMLDARQAPIAPCKSS